MTLSRAFADLKRLLSRLLTFVLHPGQAFLSLQNGRKTLVSMAFWAVNHHHLWDYNQRRPVRYRLWPRFEYDCSGAVCWLYWVAGLRDPSGNAYTGADTYTMTLLQHGREIGPSQVLPGDVVILGKELPVAEQHAMMAVEKGADPMCFSHGSEGNPTFVRSHVDPRSHTWVRFDVLRVHRIRWPRA